MKIYFPFCFDNSDSFQRILLAIIYSVASRELSHLGINITLRILSYCCKLLTWVIFEPATLLYTLLEYSSLRSQNLSSS